MNKFQKIVANILGVDEELNAIRTDRDGARATVKEYQYMYKKVLIENKAYKKEINRLKNFDYKNCQNKLDYLNYLICRCMDIDFYSNKAVFKTKFERGRNWRHPKTTEYDNLEQFQVDYLMKIQDMINQIQPFIENCYSEELEKLNMYVKGENNDNSNS